MKNEYTDSAPQDLIRELEWLKAIIERRFRLTFEKNYADPNDHELKPYEEVTTLLPPDLSAKRSNYALFVQYYQLRFEQRFLLILTLAPHLAPELLDQLLRNRKSPQGRGLCETGGTQGSQFRGFLPTGLTYLFLLAGYQQEKRLQLMDALYAPDHILLRQDMISIAPVLPGEPVFSGILSIDERFVQWFTMRHLTTIPSEFEAPENED